MLFAKAPVAGKVKTRLTNHCSESQAAEIAKVAEGVVVGSALVDLVGEFGEAAPAKLQELTAAMVRAIKEASQ